MKQLIGSIENLFYVLVFVVVVEYELMRLMFFEKIFLWVKPLADILSMPITIMEEKLEQTKKVSRDYSINSD
jgi:hypothetical protein